MAIVRTDQIFVATTGTLLSTGTTTNLGVGQLGLFDVPSYIAQTAPNFSTVKALQIVQGTSDDPLNVGTFQSNSSDKTPIIKAGKVTDWRGLASQKAQNGIVILGHDGIDITKNLTMKPGETKKFWVRLSGTAIDYLMGGTSRYIKEEFTVKADCVDDCTDNCAATVDCTTILSKIMTTVGERKIVGGLNFTDFIQVQPITANCQTPSGYVTTACTQWNLLLPDAGDKEALGIVQTQYPGQTVKLISRSGIYSTYQIVQCGGGNAVAPTVFSNQVSPVIPNCSTCPSGYTNIAAATSFSIIRAGNISATTIQANYAPNIISTSVAKLSFNGSQSVFLVYSTNSLATLQAIVTTDIVAQVGGVQSICVLNAPGSTTAWSNVGACTSANTLFDITLQIPGCGSASALLTTLQAIYGSSVALITSNSATCTAKYSVLVQSDQSSCLTCGDQVYTFTAPAPYNATQWIETDGTVTGVGCYCGVKFTSAYISRARKACYFDDVPYVTEPIFIEVSEFHFDDVDFLGLCSTPWAVTNVQTAQYAAGNGSFIADFEKLSKYYFNKPWRSSPAERDVLGYEFLSQFDQYYDQYVLDFTVDLPKGYQGTDPNFTYSWSFYLPAGQGTAFQNAINAWLTSQNASIAPVTL